MFDFSESNSARATEPEASTLTLEYGNADSRRFVSSQEELARRLGVSRRTLSLWRSREDCPRARANGLYFVAEWEDFAKSNRLKLESENTSVKAQREQVALEREKLALEKARGNLVPADEVAATWTAAAEILFAQITWKTEQALTDIGLDEANAHVRAEKIANDVFTELRNRLSARDVSEEKEE